jgi:hypothetical protein
VNNQGVLASEEISGQDQDSGGYDKRDYTHGWNPLSEIVCGITPKVTILNGLSRRGLPVTAQRLKPDAQPTPGGTP